MNVFVVQIPPSSTVAFYLQSKSNLNISTYPYKTLWSSKTYGRHSTPGSYSQIQYNIGSDIKATFKVIHIYPYGSLMINDKT